LTGEQEGLDDDSDWAEGDVTMRKGDPHWNQQKKYQVSADMP